MIWSNLNAVDQTAIISRIEAGATAFDVAPEYALNPESLARKVRLLRERGDLTLPTIPSLEYTRMFISEPTRVLIYADPHFGEEDQDALEAVLIIAEEFQPELIVNLGDTLDGDKVSRFASNEDAASLQYERDAWGEWCERLHSVCNPLWHHIILGNHDLRYEKAIAGVPGLIDIDELSMDNLLYTSQLGLMPVVDGIYINPKGDDLYPDAMLYLFHGSMARKFAGSSVRAMSSKYSVVNIAVGHAHRTSMITQRTDRGMIRGFEVGCLRTLTPDYDAFPDWSNSVLTGVISSDFFDLSPVIIDRGRFAFNGTIYTVD